ncbi:hypothetical protein E2C01_005416 [Portunus trituberculatus]|uniref:Uncharacterized protein n=1 Tax=Portunus trituberculatus TaxID=210409 RepID=A0A5B7CV35_PORTR|nr:hypothetical protein [Portunus trituberculatus]
MTHAKDSDAQGQALRRPAYILRRQPTLAQKKQPAYNHPVVRGGWRNALLPTSHLRGNTRYARCSTRIHGRKIPVPSTARFTSLPFFIGPQTLHGHPDTRPPERRSTSSPSTCTSQRPYTLF